MKILMLKNRYPVIITPEEFGLLKKTIEDGRREMIIRGNLVNLYGAQTFDTLEEVEDIYAMRQNKRRCGFGKWHPTHGGCTCPDNCLPAPLEDIMITNTDNKRLGYNSFKIEHREVKNG